MAVATESGEVFLDVGLSFLATGARLGGYAPPDDTHADEI